VYPHRIRLRGPWECEPLARAGDGGPLPPALRMTLPCRWTEGGLADFAGRVRFRRRFGYPGRIDDTERVWLTCAGLEGSAVVALNGRNLGAPEDPACGFEYEVTALLLPRNELVIDLDGPANGGLWGEVALEVRRTAYLRAVRVRHADGMIHAEGLAVGTSGRPLDLYLLLGRSTVAYATVIPSADGTPFALAGEAAVGATAARVELVDGATVWYTLERPLDPPAP
jgi:hypothetical protein